jgi:putative transposase
MRRHDVPGPADKTELINARRPWRGFDAVEIETTEWVDWHNHRRSFEYCDDLTPVEAETAHYGHHQPLQQLEPSNQ